ncbi:putative O-glycosylation ligase, exosortase A system-associated [Telluria aromaticivorans]|uniref:Putative O-glycosylation ligase, exosortase A system-associated n=1 Tax=Telluria aromaticivorans TaxID=2725995 RepID=A0A7Y2K038_9BURK|nr:putative O-glycosylation ligase, exosortase A system-associated [Telluria aromaticivorans]NNG24210.1 putative O-glycosylation ligase, exosortase A system-associated [Telluria aromaticivorans]
MRDIFLLAMLPLMLYAMAQRSFIALAMWPWTALFFPNGWVYGIAGSIRYNLLFAGVTIFTYLAQKDKPKFRLTGLGVLVLLFFIWTTLSTIMTIGRPEIAWEYWNRFLKVVVLFMFVLAIIEKKLHIDVLLWGIVLSVGFYGNLEALKFIASGGSHMITGLSGHVLGDRNELALAFVMTLPICVYLLGEYGWRSRILQISLIGTMCLLIFAVIGTQSRGGFIALLTLGAYLFMKSERKALMAVFTVILVTVLANYVSSEWTARIDTIESANEDASFMGRVVAWKLSFIMATQHPLFGGGFKALETFSVYSELTRHFYEYAWFYTGDALPPANFARAAHSVYFQVLGDHGFVGLFIYVACLITAWRKAGRAARTVKRAGGPAWLATVSTMIQLSIFAFAFGGAALSFAYFDLIFTLFGLVIVLESRIVPAELAKLTNAAEDADGTIHAYPSPTRPANDLARRKFGHENAA